MAEKETGMKLDQGLALREKYLMSRLIMRMKN